MSRPNTPTYKTLNWPSYNKALKRRGSLAIWFDPDMVWAAKPTGKRGRQPVYSDAAVQTCLTIKVLFGMALFGEVPGWATFAGAAIIIAANLFLTWRERRSHRA